MKINVSLALTAAVLLSACAGMPSPPPMGSLKVATWNIEHLAEKDGEGCRPRTEADYALLRRHADALNADVIAFQEVQSEAAARRVFDPQRGFQAPVGTRPTPKHESNRIQTQGEGVGRWNPRGTRPAICQRSAALP